MGNLRTSEGDWLPVGRIKPDENVCQFSPENVHEIAHFSKSGTTNLRIDLVLIADAGSVPYSATREQMP